MTRTNSCWNAASPTTAFRSPANECFMARTIRPISSVRPAIGITDRRSDVSRESIDQLGFGAERHPMTCG